MTDNAEPIPLIFTRPRAASIRFWESLPNGLAKALRAVHAPLIEIEPLGSSPDSDSFDAAIFTSANAVRLSPEGAGRIACCVGPRTTDAARARGWQARQMGQTVDDLVKALSAEAPTQRFLHLSGLHTRGNLVERLTAVGLSVNRLALYDQPAQNLSKEARGLVTGQIPAIITFFSPRTAQVFASQVSEPISAHIVALSQNIAAELGESGVNRVDIAAHPTPDAMVEAIEKCVRRLRAT